MTANCRKNANSNFYLCSLPRGLTLPTLLVLERFEIVLLPFSNPQFICMPAICILLEIHVCLMIPQSYRESTSQTQVATILKVKTSMRGWRAGDRIYFDGLHYCTADTSSLFKCNSRIPLWPPGKGRSDSQSGAPLPQAWHLIWQPSHCTVCVINMRAGYSSVSLRGSDTAMLWMQTDIISWVFWHSSQ